MFVHNSENTESCGCIRFTHNNTIFLTTIFPISHLYSKESFMKIDEELIEVQSILETSCIAAMYTPSQQSIRVFISIRDAEGVVCCVTHF